MADPVRMVSQSLEAEGHAISPPSSAYIYAHSLRVRYQFFSCGVSQQSGQHTITLILGIIIYYVLRVFSLLSFALLSSTATLNSLVYHVENYPSHLLKNWCIFYYFLLGVSLKYPRVQEELYVPL